MAARAGTTIRASATTRRSSRLNWVGVIDALLPTRKAAKYRAISGLSMGGYGSMKIGLKYPTVFGSISSMSGALGYMQWSEDADAMVTEGIDVASNDPFQLALKVPDTTMPAIYLDCGKQDDLMDDSRKFDALLRRNAIPHTFNQFEGGHDWAYWDAHIQDVLRFHQKAMGL